MTNDFIASQTVEALAKVPLNYKFTGKQMAQVWSFL
jgi:hypothetical protein